MLAFMVAVISYSNSSSSVSQRNIIVFDSQGAFTSRLQKWSLPVILLWSIWLNPSLWAPTCLFFILFILFLMMRNLPQQQVRWVGTQGDSLSQGIAIDYSQTLHSMMTSSSLSGFALILILFVKYIYSSSLFLLLIFLSCSKNTNHPLVFLSSFPNVLFVAPYLHRFLVFFSNTKLRLEKQIPFLTSYFINGK